MLIKDFLTLFGGEDEDKVAFYECDEREEITITVKTALEDGRYDALLRSEIASWDYEDGILCIYYFREEN